MFSPSIAYASKWYTRVESDEIQRFLAFGVIRIHAKIEGIDRLEDPLYLGIERIVFRSLFSADLRLKMARRRRIYEEGKDSLRGRSQAH